MSSKYPLLSPYKIIKAIFKKFIIKKLFLYSK